MQCSWKFLTKGLALSVTLQQGEGTQSLHSYAQVQKFSEILVGIFAQQQYLLAKLLLISSRARPTSTQISWGQNDDLLQLSNLEYANGMTYTRGVKYT